VVAAPGWWRRAGRCSYAIDAALTHEQVPDGAAPVLVTGRTGTLGQAFERACQERALPCVLTSRQELDITDEAAVRRTVERLRPWAIINAAGYVRVDSAENDAERCYRENELGSTVLARVAGESGLPLVVFSSDLVFDGRRGSAYRESDVPGPLNVYGRSKLAAEAAVHRFAERALVIRTAAFFSAEDEHNFLTRTLRQLVHARPVEAYGKVTVSPTYVPDLVATTLDLLVDGESGIWHLANAGSQTWYELALAVATFGRLDAKLVRPIPAPAYIPEFTALTSERGLMLPPLEWALERYQTALLSNGRAPGPP
jgi:dTDP-4-dehydrorhamnose reductase